MEFTPQKPDLGRDVKKTERFRRQMLRAYVQNFKPLPSLTTEINESSDF